MCRNGNQPFKDLIVDIYDLAKTNLNVSLTYINTVNRLVGGDVNICIAKTNEKIKELSRAPSHLRDEKASELMFWTRCLIRAFIAHVEGMTHVMRQTVIWAQERGEIELLDKELLKLKELDESGKPRFNSPVANLNLAFNYFPRIFDVEYSLEKNGQGWKDFKYTLDARHAITHPRDTLEFLISGEKLGRVREAVKWFSCAVRDMLFAIMSKMGTDI